MLRDLTTTRGVRESLPRHASDTNEGTEMHKALREATTDLDLGKD